MSDRLAPRPCAHGSVLRGSLAVVFTLLALVAPARAWEEEEDELPALTPAEIAEIAAVRAAARPNGLMAVSTERVTPTTIVFSELPPMAQVPSGGELREPHQEGFDREIEEELRWLKEHPQSISLSELGQVTLDQIGGISTAAPTPGTGFEGITQGGFIPGEPTCAGGPLNIFSAGNVSVTVTNKDGSNRVETNGSTFFNAPASEGGMSDAQCYYDALRGRFVALAFTQGTSPQHSNFYLNISKTNDARGAWWNYKFDMTKDGNTSTSNWGDYESLGISDDKLVMTSQQFTFSTNSYRYQKVRVIDRAVVYAGGSASYVDFFNFSPPSGGDSNDNFVTKGARNLTAGDATIHLLCVRTNGGTRVTYRTVTGTPAAPTLSSGNFVTVGSYSPPPDAVQQGSGGLVATNDCRPGDFYVRNGVLTIAWHTSANFGGGATESAIRLFQMRTSDRAVLTDETYGATNVFYYYPAATVDSVGTVFLGFDRSSSTEFPSAWATGKRRVDAALQTSALLKSGLSATNQSRWGDYTGIDNDASLSGPGGSSAWYAGQWTKGTNTFGTWVNKLTYTYGQISGTVLADCDGLSGTTGDRTPLAGVTVTAKQGATVLATKVTNALGGYSFGFFDTGVYDIVVTAPAGGSTVDALPGSGGNSQTKINAGDIQVNLTDAQTSSNNVFVVATSHLAPATTSIVPNTKNVGDGAFTMNVNGSDFLPCSVVRLDGSDRTTTYFSANLLTAQIPASDMLVGGTHNITVFTPAPAGGTSNPQVFTVNSPDNIAPTVTLTSPNGGEVWKAGSSHNITWTANDNTGVTAVDLAWSSDGGATFPNVIATGLTNSGSFAWTVPNAPTGTARVRATARDANSNSAADASDANFTIDLWVISASAGANGSIAPSGAVGVVEHANQSFTMTAAVGHHVADVLVDSGSVGPLTAYTFNDVIANHTIQASFAPDAHLLNISIVGSGSVAKSPDQPSYDYGTSVTLTATADPGFDFQGWSGDVTSTQNPLVVVMNADLNIVATFAASSAVAEPVVTELALAPVQPNPSSGGARSEFALPQSAKVSVELLDVRGRVVRTLASGEYPAGRHAVVLPSSSDHGLGSGVYFLRLQANGKTIVRRFALTK
ncbi:MAG: T9SS type A sorting domain-containing protein [Candidatus Eisenbacteria bacterium]